MNELILFYAALSVFLAGGVAYSVHLYRKNMKQHEDNHSPRAHA